MSEMLAGFNPDMPRAITGAIASSAAYNGHVDNLLALNDFDTKLAASVEGINQRVGVLEELWPKITRFTSNDRRSFGSEAKAMNEWTEDVDAKAGITVSEDGVFTIGFSGWCEMFAGFHATYALPKDTSFNSNAAIFRPKDSVVGAQIQGYYTQYGQEGGGNVLEMSGSLATGPMKCEEGDEWWFFVAAAQKITLTGDLGNANHFAFRRLL